jgi:thiamine transport system substrate-binding protein
MPTSRLRRMSSFKRRKEGIMRLSSICLAFAVALAISLVGASSPRADNGTLTVYTYSSFVSEWGPGPAIEEAFEAECDCDLDWVAVEDGAALLSRLRLEGDDTEADVVLGLDTSLMASAAETGLFAPHGVTMPIFSWTDVWNDPLFVPFDYGYFAVIYDSEIVTDPPASLEDLVTGPASEKIVLEDPRTSTPGLGFLLWMRSVYGNAAPAKWRELEDRILTVAPGWSEAYGLFLDGEAPMVLSYTTSPAYHINAEGTDRYKAAIFPEGHYMQIEVAGMTRVSEEPDLAKQFLAFMLTDRFQSTIPTGNWMYPVVFPREPLPEGFADVVQENSQALLFSPETVAENRQAWIDEWLRALSD